MALANELFDAAELTGIARAEAELIDEQSLARYLPNEYITSHIAEFRRHGNGLAVEARYRAFDAEPEILAEPEEAEDVTIKLPAVSRNEPLSEQQQLRLNSSSDETVRGFIEDAMRRSVRSVYATVNRQRANVLLTGEAVANQSNFRLRDDFGRDPDLTTTATSLWSDPAADRLEYLETLRDLYAEKSGGAEPGVVLMRRSVFSALARGDQFAVTLGNGSARRGNADEVRGFIEAADLPPIEVINDRTAAGSLIPGDTLLMLPAPVGSEQPDATELGSTVWGQTVTAMAEGFDIEESDLPGIVCGVFAPSKIPYVHEVMSDSLALPVLKNPDLSLAAKVL